MFGNIGKILILGGIFLVLFGTLLIFCDKIPFLGKLPGDIAVQKENLRFYFPLATCFLISLGLTLFLNLIFLILWILRK